MTDPGTPDGRLSDKRRALFELLMRDRRREPAADADAIPRRPIGETAPLSFTQSQLWFLDQWQPRSSAYNVPVAYRLAGALDLAALNRAVTEVIRRHEPLRTTYAGVGPEVFQHIAPPAPALVEVVDLSQLPPGPQAAALQQALDDEAQRPFDLRHDVMLRARVIHLGPDDHALQFTVHHIACDGWSLRILLEEIAHLYSAFLTGVAPDLPDPAVRYADYAAWQRERVEGETVRRQVAHFVGALAGAPALLALPTDRGRSALTTQRGGRRVRTVSAEVTSEARRFSQDAGATLFMTTLAALAALLARYSSHTDIVIGSPTAGRTRRELEGVVGFFANALPWRIDVSGPVTFQDLVQRVKRVTLAVHENQEAPFERVVEALRVPRDAGHSPVFQVAYALHGESAPLALPGLRATALDVAPAHAKLDLFLEVFDTGTALSCALDYNRDLFDDTTAERMMSSFEALLAAGVAEPHRDLRDLTVLPADERRQLESWNATSLAYPRSQTIHGLVAAQVLKTPTRIAVRCGEASLTYAQLDQRALHLAGSLHANGVRRGDRVGLCVDRGAEMLVAMLAVLRCGAAYVPLDSAFPVERLRFMAQDADLALVVSSAPIAESIGIPQHRELLLAGGQPRADAAVETATALAPVETEDPAYVIYTSGSTGTPKGVVVPHRAVVNLLTSMAKTPGLGESDVLLAVTTLAFDIAVLELLLPLTVGATTVVASRDDSADGRGLGTLLASSGATAMQATPATWRLLLEAGWPGTPGLKVLVGGETLPEDLAGHLLERGMTVWNMYGPTETTVWSTCGRVRDLAAPISIGRPIANTTIRIVDADGRLSPIGVPGELCIGGDGLSLGYWRRPELTAERFIPDNFSDGAGAMLYRTGDLARWRADGTLQHLGRLDFQVKLRGYRIEPGEIEAKLLEEPGVQQAVVVVREDVPGDQRLIAYLVAAAAPPGLIDRLRARLRTVLPDYMVPAGFVALDRLPLTANLKVDRRALPVPEQSAASGAGQGSPITATEQILAGFWHEVLGVPNVGVTDNFFDLGGHSLLATQVVARVSRAFSIDLPLRDFFAAPTLGGQAARVDALRAAPGAGLAVPPPQPRAEAGPAALSFAQHRLWFLHQLMPGTPFYNIPVALRLQGRLDLPALAASLDALAGRHAVLRTGFRNDGSTACQVVAEPSSVAMPLVDLTSLPESTREDRARQLLDEEGGRAFDLSAGGLFRVQLVRLSAADHVLQLTLHHLIADGASIPILLRDLGAFYAAFSTGTAPTLPLLPIQFADYSTWQRRWLTDAALSGQLDYWRHRLAGLQQLRIPTDRVRSGFPTYAGGRESLTLSPALAAALHSLSQRSGATLYMVLLAAFNVLLARYSGQDDLVVGTPIANRTRHELEDLIGFFANNLVLRIDASGDPDFLELLGRVRSVALEAYDHQDLPFERLVEVLDPERDPSRNPLFQIMFAVQPAANWSHLFAEQLTASEFAGPVRTARFDLEAHVSQERERLRVDFIYSTDLWNAASVKRLLGHYERVLQAVVDDPRGRLSTLPLLSDAERTQVIDDWNRTDTPYPADQPIHRLFEQQAARTPEAPAVEFGGARLTYRELNARANQLARHLARHGVGPEVAVGLSVDRSLEMVVGVLGILKAGGAYVPLDPDYPTQRLQLMARDSAAPVVLVTHGVRERLQFPSGPHLIALDADWPEIAGEDANDLEVAVGPRALAYVMFTSGSTGAPKGTCIEHRSVVRLVRNTSYLELGRDEVFLQLAPISFDASTLELWGSLLNGGRLVICPPGPLSLDELARLIQTHGVTTLWLTASLFHQMVDSHLEALGGVRQLLAGGETLSVPHVRRMLEALGRGRLINGYGPTENTTFTCCHVMTAGAQFEGSVPIGRPISNTRVYVLDRRRQPVPVGVHGELYIGGDGLARGYLQRPELTAEKFVPDPFRPGESHRLYRTGDTVRWLPGGDLEFIGRFDDQVKIRGHRIELGEVEATLAAHPSVQQAAAVAREDTPGDKRLVAYVASRTGVAAAVAIKAYLDERLPAYMRPSAIVVLPALPLTPNGKVDRTALPAPDRPNANSSYVEPRTPTEEILAGIWAETLGVERVGIEDNFFELGGHSLLAVTTIERIRRAGLRADVRTLFTTPTVEALAAAADGEDAPVAIPANGIVAGCTAITPEMLPLVQLTPEAIAAIVAAVPGGAANVQDVYPLGPLQEGILFHHLLARQGDPYLLHGVVSFDTRQRLQQYVQAMEVVVGRHDILRTAVVWEGLPEPVQVVWRHAPLVVEELQLDPDDGPVASQLATRFDPRHHRIDLARPPLLRLVAAQDAPHDRWLLLHLFHHLALDHTSMDVVLEEVEAVAAGRADQLPPALPFRTFVGQARRSLPRQAHEEYFRELLGDVDEPTAPFGVTEVRGDGSGVAEARLPMEASLAGRLRSAARAMGVSVASVCHLAWALVLARLSGRDDVVFGTVLFGRMQGGDGADRVMGPFINTLPVRIQIGGSTVRSAVRQVQTQLARLMRHEHASLALAQRCSAVPAPAPLFTALLNYRHSAAPSAGGGRRQIMPGMEVLGGEERTNYPVVLSVDDFGTGFALTSQVQASVDPKRVCGFMQLAVEQLVDALERADELPVGQTDILPQAERHQLLVEWNATAIDQSPARSVHALFEAQAAATPAAAAISTAGVALTYQTLNGQANRLARQLREMGVQPGDVVAVGMERSSVLVTSLLAILKAGAAYLPLDVSHPRERIGFMLEDSGAALVLTTADRGSLFAGSGTATLCLDAVADRLSQWPDENLTSGADATSLAYLIYTSGSTGQPKGVPITHASLGNLIRWHQSAYAVSAADRATLLAGPAFDASVWELWPYLTAGASVYVPDEATRLDSAALVRWLVAQGITLTFLPTPLAEAALRERWPADTRLRVLLTGGDRLTQRPAAGLPFQLVNHYGPTENTVVSTCAAVEAIGVAPPAIGRPLPNTRVYVVDAHMRPSPVGVPGELLVGGAQLATGYWKRPELTAEKFIPDPFDATPGARVYRTGDLVRYRADGQLEFLGRLDQQVKIRGYRIELGEIEACLARYPAVREVVVVARHDAPGDPRLVAYVVAGDEPAGVAEQLRAHARTTLPEYMVPAAFVSLDALPLTPNGKLDRNALPIPRDLASATVPGAGPGSELERRIAAIWAEVLGLEQVGVTENFFDLGGHSLLLVKVHARLRAGLGEAVNLVDLFTYPTVAALAAYIAGHGESSPASEAIVPRTAVEAAASGQTEPIAIIGMAGRFPGAANTDALWANLRAGHEAITFFTAEELIQSGVAAATIDDPAFVPAKGYLDGADTFDAGYFGYSAREAELLDPQQRLLLECAAEALDLAGYDPDRYAGLIGVYAGATPSTYAGRADATAESGLTDVLGNAPDFLTTRVSYELNLRGPSVTVQTACSTSLVAVHQACRALHERECDLALAGGVSVTAPLKSGYRHVEGGIGSPDGHCRPFDAGSGGTIAGNGVALVALKRLSDARADGDCIRAVIRGTAINNDGSDKVGFTAPSVDGQARAIARAQAAAGVTPDTIDYVEAHGTATQLGDPIEVAALNRVFGRGERWAPCWIGSVKSNLGHLDAAAGVTGLIKAALSLEHRELVPSLHFTRPNPGIDFAAGPLQVSATLQPWQPPAHGPRRAGVSSFGLGGTNAHAVLEEAPVSPPVAAAAQRWQTLCLSAKTPAALTAARANLAGHLRDHPAIDLADAAYTLQRGRREFPHRAVAVCRDVDEAVAALDAPPSPSRPVTSGSDARPVVFMFSGQGAQYAGMARGLYDSEPVVRAVVDRCAETLAPLLGLDLRGVLFPTERQLESAAAALLQTALTQPALFVIEYAVARLWMARGVEPEAMIGHSIGEYVAACLAEVMTEDDALRLVAARGRLMQQAPPGVMLAVPFGEDEARRLAAGRADVAAVNGASTTVLSGTDDAIDSIERDLAAGGGAGTRLRTSHAFHSRLMEPVLDEFSRAVAGVTLRPPSRPYVSNVTGTWMTADDAVDPGYWVRHLRGTVRFADGVATLLAVDGAAFLEVGPGSTLASFVRKQAAARSAPATVVQSLPPADRRDDDQRQLASATGDLWAAGARIDWPACHPGAMRRRVVLPAYPFQRERYWLSARTPQVPAVDRPHHRDPGQWTYVPSWRRSAVPAGADQAGREWLVFLDRLGVGTRLATQLRRLGAGVTTVEIGEAFVALEPRRFAIDPASREDHAQMIAALVRSGLTPAAVAHLWSIDADPAPIDDVGSLAESEAHGFFSVLHLVAALEQSAVTSPVGLAVVTSHTHDVTGAEPLSPAKALVLGPCKTIAGEYPNMVARTIDVPAGDEEWLAGALASDLTARWTDAVVAYRGRYRWTQAVEPLQLAEPVGLPSRLRPSGVYVVTGGLGRVGLEVADYLARATRARIALVSRTGLPDRDRWSRWITEHGADEPTSRRILRVRQMEEAGAEVLVCRADVADQAQMAAALAGVEARFGRIHGVMHLAGDHPGQARSGEIRRQDVGATFRPKLAGLQVLESVLGDRPLDFCIVHSSLASFMGRLELTAYTAASVYMDTFVHRHNRSSTTPWQTINWDAWSTETLSPGPGAITSFAMAPHEATSVLARLLNATDVPQILVSTGDPQARIARGVRLEPATTPGPERATPPSYARPQLSTDYEPPRTDAERLLVALWCELFGVDRIGIRDNFFELGGDSVLNLQLSAKASQSGLHVPPRLIFEHQTIAELAAAVASRAGETGGTAAPVAERIEPVLQPTAATTVSAADLSEILRQLDGEGEPGR